MTRGLSDLVAGPDRDARDLGFEPASSCPDWDHEGMFHGFYRAWLERHGSRNGEDFSGAA